MYKLTVFWTDGYFMPEFYLSLDVKPAELIKAFTDYSNLLLKEHIVLKLRSPECSSFKQTCLLVMFGPQRHQKDLSKHIWQDEP